MPQINKGNRKLKQIHFIYSDEQVIKEGNINENVRKEDTMTKKKNQNKVIEGVIGVILSVLGLLLAFKEQGGDLLPFLIFLAMIIGGIVLVAKALSD